MSIFHGRPNFSNFSLPGFLSKPARTAFCLDLMTSAFCNVVRTFRHDGFPVYSLRHILKLHIHFMPFM